MAKANKYKYNQEDDALGIKRRTEKQTHGVLASLRCEEGTEKNAFLSPFFRFNIFKPIQNIINSTSSSTLAIVTNKVLVNERAEIFQFTDLNTRAISRWQFENHYRSEISIALRAIISYRTGINGPLRCSSYVFFIKIYLEHGY